MTSRVVHRAARLTRPLPIPAPRQIEAPPTLPDAKAYSNAAQMLMPLVGAMSSLTMMLVYRGTSLAAVGAVVMLATVFSSVAMMMGQRGKATRTRRQQRERYLDYLEEIRQQLGREEAERRTTASLLDPAPQALIDVVRDSNRLWERRRRDDDFLRVRLGIGDLPGRQLDVRADGTSLNPTDPFMLSEAMAVVERFREDAAMPLTVPLDSAGDISVVGERADVARVARLLVTQVAALHAPDDVMLALAHPPKFAADWEFARWLPHLSGGTAARPKPRVAADPQTLADLLGDDLATRTNRSAEARRNLGTAVAPQLVQRLLVFHDMYGVTAQNLPVPDRESTLRDLGITVVHLVADRLHEPGDVAVRIVVKGDHVVVEDVRTGQRPLVGELDRLPASLAEAIARILGPLRLSADSAIDIETDGRIGADFRSLLGIRDPGALDIGALWRHRSERELLRVPLGVDDAGRPVMLDLKEPAQLGMGPHGLCVGATGSGKSELLRTLVLSLLATHSPEQLSMILIDYKGGATFAPFVGLPHVAGVITNLADDVSLVERVHTSLAGEVQRRQEVLKNAGNVANITDYAVLREERARVGDQLPPLPHLLVIIDEFGELLTAKPDFIELFLSIGRIGRSIGVHLLLSSQRIEGGRLKGLDTYLSYRIGMRTFSEAESRSVLETPDAFHLPPLPGFGYLKVDTTIYQRFLSAYVSGRYEGPQLDDAAAIGGPLVRAIPQYGLVDEPALPEQQDSAPELPRRGGGATVMSVMVDQLRDAAPPVPAVWLPPLPEAITLDQAGGGTRATRDGLRLNAAHGNLRVPLGLLDDPARQWQGLWELDLARAGGHVVVIGGPQSGKTTLLRTLMLSTALGHTPQQTAMYAVDLLGGGMSVFGELPHVGGVAGRGDRERVRRTFEEMQAMLEQREKVFRDRHIDGLDAMRALHTTGQLPELPVADVFLFIDGYGQLAHEFEQFEQLVHGLLARGSSYGVHVICTVSRWNEVRIAQQAAFGTRVELRLNDPADSAIDHRLATAIRSGLAGRALTDGKLLAHVALPRIDGAAEAANLGDALRHAVMAIDASCSGEGAPRVRVLPAVLDEAELPEPLAACTPIGLDEASFESALLDLDGVDQHFLVLGDGGCGKSSVLRLVARQLMKSNTADDVVFAVVDPRRSLHNAIPDEFLGAYATSAPQAARLGQAVAAELAKRLPDDLAVPAKSSGSAPKPRIVLLVDDYDVLSASGSQPLAALGPYLAAARDVGFHVFLTRRVSGASRGLYDPSFLLPLREAGVTGLVMSGDRSEGVLLANVRAEILPRGRGILVRQGEPPAAVQVARPGEPTEVTGVADPRAASQSWSATQGSQPL